MRLTTTTCRNSHQQRNTQALYTLVFNVVSSVQQHDGLTKQSGEVRVPKFLANPESERFKLIAAQPRTRVSGITG